MTTDSQVHDARTTMEATSIATTIRTNALQAMVPVEKPKKFAGLIVNEAFQVAAIIEKLPPMWKNFKNYFKHKYKEMSVKYLIVRLCIEEDNKATKRKPRENSAINGANTVEDDQNNSKKQKKVGNESNQPKKKFKGKYLNCGKIVHKSMDCHTPKKG
ncbi:hypothetical protein T459_16987 [Capsicum annuum]|uniref:Uncharacterized protein n=1 Tax=Capsicum annuum TaxID=4072 RepID=A0A2G2ZAN7_CAPAN|nr:hypothetical protein T459_16987 [Capsicum annuum]